MTEQRGIDYPDRDGAGHILLSTAEVAEILGVTPGRVRQLAQSRSVGRTVGRTRVYTFEDVSRMANREPGRPRKES